MYYLAYGSNINPNVMAKEAKNAKFIKTMVLNNYKLAFKSLDDRAFLTIEKDLSSNLDVVIYDISDEDIKTLDIYEEVEENMYFKDYIDIKINEKIEKVLVYLMNLDAKYLLPHHDYVKKVIDGYKYYGFKLDNIFKALNECGKYNMNDIMNHGFYNNPMYLNQDESFNTRKLLDDFNNTSYDDFISRRKIASNLFAELGKNALINKPFHCDHGKNIYIGDNFYANYNLLILDVAKVKIGNNCFFGPNVSLLCPLHPLSSEMRNTNHEYGKEINIGNNVWIASNVVINPGVNIGDDVVIGSGSVVTKDIPSGYLAYGNPCRIIRKIDEKDLENERLELEITRSINCEI